MHSVKGANAVRDLSTRTLPQTPVASSPVLFTQDYSTRAIALESTTLKGEPFSLTSPFAQDGRTRIMIFALNVDLLPSENASAITADALDDSNHYYDLTAEYVGPLQGYDWISSIVLRLNDNLEEAGDVLIRIRLHGASSNSVRVGLGHIGGGPPDPTPTPTPTPIPSPTATPTPTSTPTPTPTATPTPTPTPTPSPGPTGNVFYVSPNASSGGDGSPANPWKLGTVCAGDPAFGWPPPPPIIQPGATIYLRGGTYTGAFHCNVNGTATEPVKLVAYPGESVILDNPIVGGQQSIFDAPLLLAGNYLWAVGLELTNSNPNRFLNRPAGAALTGIGTKLINCIAHDNGVGVFPNEGQQGGEVYGCLLYNNGWIDAVSGPSGEGIYMQNDVNTKVIKDNIVFNNYNLGIQAYSSSRDVLKGFDIEGNAVFGNGTPVQNFYPAILVGGTHVPAARLTIDSNYLYNGGMNLGYFNPFNVDALVTNNIVAGASNVEAKGWQSLTFTGNKIYNPDFGFVVINQSDLPAPGYLWNNNSYFTTNAFNKPFLINQSPASWYDLAAWRMQTGFDSSSTSQNALPTGTDIIIRTNAYDQNRWNIIVYNWSGAATVDIDLSHTLAQGDSYELRNGQDYFASPILTGAYSGVSLTVPMIGLTFAPPLGGDISGMAPTGPFYNVFVLIRH